MPKSENIELVIPEQFKELFQPSQQWRHLVYKGGRSSTKSTEVGISRLLLGEQKKQRGQTDKIIYKYDWNANPDSLSKLYNRGEIKQERE